MVELSDYEVKDFVDCCQDVGLEDVPYTGCVYTYNYNSKWRKLDRVMMNGPWNLSGWLGQSNFLPSGVYSDHSPCIVSIFQQDKPKNKPFKFFNMWAKHDDFENVV